MTKIVEHEVNVAIVDAGAADLGGGRVLPGLVGTSREQRVDLVFLGLVPNQEGKVRKTAPSSSVLSWD
jgi:hypothetical protein